MGAGHLFLKGKIYHFCLSDGVKFKDFSHPAVDVVASDFKAISGKAQCQAAHPTKQIDHLHGVCTQTKVVVNLQHNCEGDFPFRDPTGSPGYGIR